MKIIKEIEKSRLKEKEMVKIKGGDNYCKPKYLLCSEKYEMQPCVMHNSCSEVTICGTSQYKTCAEYEWIWA